MKIFSLFGLFNFISLKIQGKSILVCGSCKGCGNCCKRLNLEGSGGWLRSEKIFSELAGKHPEYKRFKITGKDSQGFLVFNCSWCDETGLCSDYENRLPLCKNFPEKNLLFSGGELPLGCGYSFKRVVPFDKLLTQEIKKHNETNSHS